MSCYETVIRLTTRGGSNRAGKTDYEPKGKEHFEAGAAVAAL